jgi:hypothetical protein
MPSNELTFAFPLPGGTILLYQSIAKVHVTVIMQPDNGREARIEHTGDGGAFYDWPPNTGVVEVFVNCDGKPIDYFMRYGNVGSPFFWFYIRPDPQHPNQEIAAGLIAGLSALQ